MELRAYFRKLWMGRVTASENIKWFIPIWLWFALVVWVALRKSSSQILFVTFFLVCFASAVPFLCRRVGLFRWWLFGWAFPVIVAIVVTQCFRSFCRFP